MCASSGNELLKLSNGLLRPSNELFRPSNELLNPSNELLRPWNGLLAYIIYFIFSETLKIDVDPKFQ